MRLLEVYGALQGDHITHDEAAKLLGITARDLKFRITRWGPRLPILCATLDMIADGTCTRAEASAMIGVSERQVNHLMETWKVSRPIAKYVVDQTISQIKWEIRKKYAIEFIGGFSTIEEAAEGAEVSTRQMRRWVSDLLDEHFQMAFKDLKDLTPRKRAQLAQEIEDHEGFEYAKRAVLQSISRGETTLQEEAAARVAHKATKRGRNVRWSKAPKSKA